MNLACGGVRRAMPLITGAALTDAAYSLLAASGVLIASQTSADLLVLLTPCFLLATAILCWLPSSPSSKVTFGATLLNPATAAIWLSLSSLPALRSLSTSDLLLWPLPVALGTATWFTLLALATAKLNIRLSSRLSMGLHRAPAIALAIMGLASLMAVFH
jgi:threonine/homoserine/homoserine lactone efflux protein